jgi:hypothetical protein
MSFERHIPAQIGCWLGQAIQECERRIRAVEFQLKVDRGYVGSPEAGPGEIAYYRCQIALNLIERDGLERKLALLKEWSVEPGRRGDLPESGPRPAQR